MKQLLEVLYNVRVTREVKNFLNSDLPELPIIDSIRDVLEPQKYIEENIDRCILSEDEMADNASPELKSIRRKKVQQGEAITARLNNIINSSSNRTYLQDAIVTMRDGRYCIPVKQEHRAHFPGMIHDRSQTGATLFIEPQAIVNLNNELRELELAEKAEMQRVLEELTASVAQHYHELTNNQGLLLKLDYMFAKGKLSSAMHAEQPQIAEDSGLLLKEARHPLLDEKKAVPITVTLGKVSDEKEYHTLVITGPNTGGKTVTLKTVGLLAMMAQSGLHIPASGMSRIPVYEKIYADIGDEQSIEQNLSTFSSHMKNIVEIVKDANPDTLVLVDELGAGTDPTEGAALAISVLEHVRRSGAFTIATTHYNELKKYAISTPDVENACMEFNVETLSPTYKLLVGVPGRSNAFEISRKLGLDGEVIDDARALLESGDIEFEEVITSLEADRRAAEAEREDAAAMGAEIKRQKEEIDKLKARLERDKEKILSEAREEARSIVKDAQETAKEVQQELKELAKMDSLGERTRRYDENKRRLNQAEKKYREKIVVSEEFESARPEDIKIGSQVKVMTIGQNGEVISLPDSSENVQVQIGLMKVTAKVSDLKLLNVKRKKVKEEFRGTKYGTMYRTKSQQVSLSINIVGKNLDDAIMEVDKYLDDAMIANLENVTIIHGRGEGILRAGVQKLCKSHKAVASFRKGKYNEGGDGVTVVTLKR
jgi:DNA mismatch repair protein MutS2